MMNRHEYAFVEVYNGEDGGGVHSSTLGRTPNRPDAKYHSELGEVQYDQTNLLTSNGSLLSGTIMTAVDILDLKNSLCKQIDDSLIVFRRKLNQSLEKKFDVLEAKMADIQNDIEDLRCVVEAQCFPTSLKNTAKSKFPDPTPEEEEPRASNKVVTMEKLQELFDCSFPLKTIDDFKEFDSSISDDLYDDLKCHLISSINTDKSLKVICSIIFKKFFSRDVLIATTAQKKSNVKLLFKETNYFVCLKDAMRVAFFRIDVIEEKSLLKAIGGVINNSVDWEGHRVKRQKIMIENSTASESVDIKVNILPKKKEK